LPELPERNSARAGEYEFCEAEAKRVMRLKLLGIVIGIIVVVPILAWKWGLF
jgi:hypothetical protein